ncbi:FixH family protein [Asticcacaulis sp. AC402]|uniref:FixH family protein n=1 Tax=Asticcacaulis sp. AC402 TaxID=1282361 RepID=UPI0003C3E3E1|nr:FixH family protein [Asticcacaulis sp. AC402]ESQ77662.1 hypothetical protein ABAC402_00610 [Asticcacaulis sp. AC402]
MSAILSSPDPAPSAERDRQRGRIVPWLIAAFYVTFMSAFIGFVVIAYSHPPHAVTENAYEKGLAYNDTLAQANAQAQMAWQSDIAYADGRLIFRLRDHAGDAIEGARVRAWFVHPSNGTLDRGFDLRHDGAGAYSVEAPLPTKGLWNVHVTAEQKDRQYQAAAQIEVD